MEPELVVVPALVVGPELVVRSELVVRFCVHGVRLHGCAWAQDWF